VKEPFVRLIQGSLNTFLNAFTYPDRTVYPVASQNVQDFYNLASVYLDAVFFPRATHDPRILAQEGWHYELENVSEPLTLKGVVFNEMKGVYSNPDALLGRAVQQALFPDNTYAVDSGGDPASIPTLTFDKFQQFHAAFYHPSNARLFFYGDDPEPERLALVDRCLGDGDYHPISVAGSKVSWQPKLHSLAAVRDSYPAAPGSGGVYVTTNWVVNEEVIDPDTALVLAVADHLLLGTSAAILQKRLTDSGLGDTVIGGGLDSTLQQMTFSVGLKGVASEANATLVVDLVLDCLGEMAMDGFPADAIEASLNTIEFQLREFNTGGYPKVRELGSLLNPCPPARLGAPAVYCRVCISLRRVLRTTSRHPSLPFLELTVAGVCGAQGLLLLINSLESWIYGEDPFEQLRFEGPLRRLRIAVASGKPVFRDAIAKYLVRNDHRVSVTLVPDGNLEAQQQATETAMLAAAKAGMTSADLQRVVDDTRELKQMQAATDDEAALQTIPRLAITDLNPKSKETPIDVVPAGVGDAVALHHSLPTNGILYVDICIELTSLSATNIALVPLFERLLFETGTTDRSRVDFSRWVDARTGGVHALHTVITHTPDFPTEPRVASPEHARLYLVLRGKCTRARIDDLFGIFHEALVASHLDDRTRTIEILRERVAGFKSSIVSSGHAFVASALGANLTAAGNLQDSLSGVSAFHEAKRVLRLAEDERTHPGVVASFESIRRHVLAALTTCVVNLSADATVLALAQSSVRTFLQSTAVTDVAGKSDAAETAASTGPPPWQAPQRSVDRTPILGFTIPTKVNYIGAGGRLYDPHERIDGSSVVAVKLLKTGYASLLFVPRTRTHISTHLLTNSAQHVTSRHANACSRSMLLYVLQILVGTRASDRWGVRGVLPARASKWNAAIAFIS
jgi:Zn-dependent M16 (insulinase) family peptidase